MGAAIVAEGSSVTWKVGGDDAVQSKTDRKVYLHLPMCKTGAKIRLAGGDVLLEEGDGAFMSNVKSGDNLLVESLGSGQAEVVLLDSN